MNSIHQIIYKDSHNMDNILSETINLVVTSPPYPMFDMWDTIFSTNNDVETALKDGDGRKAYILMHEGLNEVWKEVDRVLAPGGIACINIGDAPRRIGDSYQMYSNHTRIISYFEEMGYHVLPSIVWQKFSNKPNKFMGSGMLPVNAYVTLENEHILIFRKGEKRIFTPEENKIRHESAYFWEERNTWYSNIWDDLYGIPQGLNDKGVRSRSGAYPFDLPYRLINMYSIRGDNVLDPFVGTGTTMLAAMCAGRNSVGYEIDKNFKNIINDKVNNFLNFSKEIVMNRIENHIKFVAARRKDKGELKYDALKYDFMVMTKDEKDISFQLINKIEKINKDKFKVFYTSLDKDIMLKRRRRVEQKHLSSIGFK